MLKRDEAKKIREINSKVRQETLKSSKKKEGLIFKSKEQKRKELLDEAKRERQSNGRGKKVSPTKQSLKFKGNVDNTNIRKKVSREESQSNRQTLTRESYRQSQNKQSMKAKLIRQSWGYTELTESKKIVSEAWEGVEVEENERVISKRVVMESVNDITGLSFLEKLKLVLFYRAKTSGKLDEQRAQEEYNRNYERLKMENGLKNTLLTMARNNLEVAEHDTIVISIDPKFRDVLDTCIGSRALSSYEFSYLRREDILVNQGKDVIVISMKLKKIM